MRQTAMTLTAIIVVLSALNGYGRLSYHDNPALSDGRLYLALIDSAPATFAIEARCAMPFNKVSRRSVSSWQLVWDYVDSDNFHYARFAIDYSKYADGIDSPEVIITMGNMAAGNDIVGNITVLRSGLNFDIGYNSMAVEWRDGTARAYAGANRLTEAGSLLCPTPHNRQCGIMSTDSLIISQFITESEIPLSRPLHTGWIHKTIVEHITQSADSIEGLWHHLDRTNDPTKARIGGRYTLATIWNSETKMYDIIYIDGAGVNPKEWTTGMVKGHLRPTAFHNHFDLIWYDALCTPIKHDCNATITQPAILELNFPLMETSIRLSRLPLLLAKKNESDPRM